MTKEEIIKQVSARIVHSESPHFMLEIATGYGKTKLALDKCALSWYNRDMKILIVVPRLLLFNGWKEEIKKWRYDILLPNITFTTYKSLDKHMGNWDVVIFDEGHHTSERCMGIIKDRRFNTKHVMVLSATLKTEHKRFFMYNFRGIEIVTIDTQNAIDDGVLSTPKIILIPLELENTKMTYQCKKFKKVLPCTQKGYYNISSAVIQWYKDKVEHTGNARLKQVQLKLSGDRLKWLAVQKRPYIKYILRELNHQRILTFAPSIEESSNINCCPINSKVGTVNLDKFNAGKIKHISAVGMLDEGANLTSCKIGLFQMINSSTRLNVQRAGRIFRHKQPILIFPFFKNTREEEIIQEIVSSYNSEYIETITNINNLKV